MYVCCGCFAGTCVCVLWVCEGTCVCVFHRDLRMHIDCMGTVHCLGMFSGVPAVSYDLWFGFHGSGVPPGVQERRQLCGPRNL